MENIEGFASVPSRYSVDETVVNIVTLLREKGIKLFAVIDHSGEARVAGLSMPATRVVIFGNPKAGTPLMQTAPSIAIDLPLKLLVAADAQGKVSIHYNTAAYLGERHHLPQTMHKVLGVSEDLARQAAS